MTSVNGLVIEFSDVVREILCPHWCDLRQRMLVDEDLFAKETARIPSADTPSEFVHLPEQIGHLWLEILRFDKPFS